MYRRRTRSSTRETEPTQLRGRIPPASTKRTSSSRTFKSRTPSPARRRPPPVAKKAAAQKRRSTATLTTTVSPTTTRASKQSSAATEQLISQLEQELSRLTLGPQTSTKKPSTKAAARKTSTGKAKVSTKKRQMSMEQARDLLDRYKTDERVLIARGLQSPIPSPQAVRRSLEAGARGSPNKHLIKSRIGLPCIDSGLESPDGSPLAWCATPRGWRPKSITSDMNVISEQDAIARYSPLAYSSRLWAASKRR